MIYLQPGKFVFLGHLYISVEMTYKYRESVKEMVTSLHTEGGGWFWNPEVERTYFMNCPYSSLAQSYFRPLAEMTGTPARGYFFLFIRLIWLCLDGFEDKSSTTQNKSWQGCAISALFIVLLSFLIIFISQNYYMGEKLCGPHEKVIKFKNKK